MNLRNFKQAVNYFKQIYKLAATDVQTNKKIIQDNEFTWPMFT